MDDFEKELKVGFLEEASQLLTDTEQCFLSLEGTPDDPAILEKIFRLAHNLKGSGKAVGFSELSVFTHEFETFLLKLKNKVFPVSTPAINLMLRCNDAIKGHIDSLKADLNATVDHTALIRDIQQYSGGETQPSVAAEVAVADPLPVSASAVETGTASLVPDQGHVASAEQVRELPKTPVHKSAQAAAPTDESIRVSLARVDKLVNFIGEMVILETVLKEQSLNANPTLLRKTIHQLGKVTKEVQDLAMSMRMVPLKQTFQKMQRIVRDTSGALNKKVNFHLEGEETEVDKTVLEALSDPLVHLIRNGVDHGIEMPADRLLEGKEEAGNLWLKAYHQSGKLIIEIRDDGGGINPEKLKKKAIEKGIIAPDVQLTPKEALHLIFAPGFSTKAVVTEVSGRGVGMDVVKTNIESIQGEVIVESEVGKGSTFKVVLPLTLAIIDAMVVTTMGERFVIPMAHVHESVKPEGNQIQKTTTLGEVLLLRGENLPLMRLNRALGDRKTEEVQKASSQIAIIVRAGAEPFATLVDDIIGHQQVVIKKLGAEIQGIKGFSGSAILGDGKPALILELPELAQKKRGIA